MGTFHVTVQLGDPLGQRFETLVALVDTGATYTWVPAPILSRLGLIPAYQFPFTLADGRQIEKGAAETRIRLDSQERTTIVVFGDEGTEPLLGAFTLEAFLVAPDPVNHRLIPVRALLL